MIGSAGPRPSPTRPGAVHAKTAPSSRAATPALTPATPRYLGGQATEKPKLGGRGDRAEHAAEQAANETVRFLDAPATAQRSIASEPPQTPSNAHRAGLFGNAAGRPLDAGTRDRFEGAMGRDLGSVRVHEGPEIDRKAQMMSTRAFTLGPDIGISNKAPRGQGASADRLMAHELAHAVDGDARHVRREPLIDSVPPQVDAESISASLSFDIPGGIELVSSAAADLETVNPTTVTLTMGRTGLQVRFSPALYLDLAWYIELTMASDMTWSGANYSFETASTSVSLGMNRSGGDAMVGGEVASQASAMITQLVRGTAAAVPGYDPLTDPDPQATLAQIRENFQSLPSTGGGGGLTPDQITNVTLGGSFNTAQDIEQVEDGTGARIASGTSVSARARMRGTAAQLGETETPQMEELHLSTSGIILQSDGEDVIRLYDLTVHPGGGVTIGRYDALGTVRDAEDTESGVRLLTLMFLLSAGSPEDRLRLSHSRPNLEPRLVQGLTVARINRILSAAVRQMIAENARAIPGIDLRSIMGMAEGAEGNGQGSGN